MERILVTKSDTQIRGHLLGVLNLKNCLQEISTEYVKFQVGTLTNDNLSLVLSDPESYIRQQITENITVPEMAGFALKREVILEQMELPSFLPIQKLAAEAQRMLQARNYAPEMHAFEINEDGEVSIMSSYETEIEERYSLYAETPEEIKIYTALENFKAAWEELDRLKHEHLGSPMPTFYHRELEVKPNTLLNIKQRFSDYKRILKSLPEYSG